MSKFVNCDTHILLSTTLLFNLFLLILLKIIHKKKNLLLVNGAVWKFRFLGVVQRNNLRGQNFPSDPVTSEKYNNYTRV